MKSRLSILLVLILVSGGICGTFLRNHEGQGHHDSATTAGKESAYDRMMRTRVIRCAYVSAPPHLVVDPGTRRISGPSHDIATEMARLLEMRVEWTEEVTWQTIF